MDEQEIRHLKKDIAYKNPHLPYSIQQITMENGYPDILFHWHTDMEIIYVHEGTARFHIAYDYFNSQPGDIFLIKPNALHSIHPIGQEKHVFSTLTFHLDMVGHSIKDQTTLDYLQPLYNGQLGLAIVVKPSHPAYDQLKRLFFDIARIDCTTPEYAAFLIKARLQELLYHVFANKLAFPKNISQDSYRKEDKIRLVIDYISQHYHRDITISELAELCGYSSAHFMNFFKKHLDLTCMDYLIQFRLRQACELLDHSNRTILDIAQQVGFNNLSNFNRQFKKYYHQTPSQHRKKRSTTSRLQLPLDEME